MTRPNYPYLLVLKMRIPEDVNPTFPSKMVKRLILIIVLILITIVTIPIWFFFVSGMYSPFETVHQLVLINMRLKNGPMTENIPN